MPIEVVTPERMSLVNLETQQTVNVQFNPTEFSIGLNVNYSQQNIIGMSHQPLHYTSTSNPTVSVELFTMLGSTELYDVDGKKVMRERDKFFQSLCYPRAANVGTIRTGAPPRVLLVWPGYISMQCVIRNYNTKASLFNNEGEPTVLTHTVNFEEIRDTRITSEEVQKLGWERTQIKRNTDGVL